MQQTIQLHGKAVHGELTGAALHAARRLQQLLVAEIHLIFDAWSSSASGSGRSRMQAAGDDIGPAGRRFPCCPLCQELPDPAYR
jgi:hypothetical protein